MLAVERDVKPRNMNFAKVEKRGGGGGGRLIGRGRLLQKIRYVQHTLKKVLRGGSTTSNSSISANFRSCIFTNTDHIF